MTKLHELNELGQSIWIDYIHREFLESGGMQAAVDDGVRGVTSNPAIFEKSIANSNDYDDQIKQLVAEGKTTAEIYEALAIRDIQTATDILRPVYDESNGVDGYVSLEVSPDLAYDTEGTIKEARRLYKEVDRPNLMIKVPATPDGIPAVETLISEGININITLMFSLDHYDKVAEAYIKGLETLADNGGDVSNVASVASFFVSRVETDVDNALMEVGTDEAKALLGTIAVANTRATYKRFLETFGSDRWQALADKGAKVQRPLWASTSTKNPSYPDTKYVDELIAADTVNTVPPDTLDMFKENGTVAITIDAFDDAEAKLNALTDVGVNLDDITENLQKVGVDKFIKPFESLMESIEAKRQKFAMGWDGLEANVQEYEEAVEAATKEMILDRIIERIWNKDHTVWQDDPTEIVNRLGWLTSADTMLEHVEQIQSLVDAVKADGYDFAMVLGMGGSSLAPEVFSLIWADADNRLGLEILDTTDPDAVRAYAEKLDVTKTLFIVSTKSGGTAETLSAFKYFYNQTLAAVGSREEAGKHFVGITDPGSKLEAIAETNHFRNVFLNDPNIGGRYSALSYFGLVPAALAGVDIQQLLQRASALAADRSDSPDNNGGYLGAIMGELAKAGRDKITLITSPRIEPFGDWVEQLIAESTGKNGTGILPVVGEALGTPDVYGDDRLFAYMRLEGDDTHDAAVDALEAAGHPVVRLNLSDVYDLGGQFFLWEMATAVAGYRLGIQPFDQPNVESAKIQARKMIDEYQETGKLPELTASITDNGIKVYGNVDADSATDALHTFLENAVDGSYVSLQAYVNPTQANATALAELQTALRDKTKMAVTLGFGPRFLHSTGQLHKGDAGRGLFIQFTSDNDADVDIPDEAGSDESGMSFGTLLESQALGDRQALLDENRHVVRFRLSDVVAGVNKLTQSI